MERTKMPRQERAKQFMPFDALKGLHQALQMKEYEHERTQKGDIDEETIEKMTKLLSNLTKNDKIKVKYYYDGHYFEVTGSGKVLLAENALLIEDKQIYLDDVMDIDLLK